MSEKGNKPKLRVIRGIRMFPWMLAALCVLSLTIVLGAEGFVPLYPTASGQIVIEKKGFTVDISNAAEGYIMAKHTGSDVRLKMRVIHDGTTTATYDVDRNGEYSVYPLSLGSGEYRVEGYEHVSGTDYALEMKKSFQVTIPDPDKAFLYPNAYVNFTADTKAVALSFELCAGLETDREKLMALYDYVSETILYDYIKAVTAQNTYMPIIDETLESRMGICFDYASLLACMLRVQGIPTKLVIGDLIPTSQKHAWNVAKLDGEWVLLEPTLRSVGYQASDYAMERYY